MGGEDNDFVIFIFFQHFPNIPSCGSIHTRCRLIKIDKTGPTYESDRHAETPLLPTTQILRQIILFEK
jgi:hypothetical protein